MITVAICLIYYGIAVWLYQVHIWLTQGQWQPMPVSAAWRVAFGMPTSNHSALTALAQWFLTWPLSLALLLAGLGLLGAVLGLRRLREVRNHQRRRRWIAEQCQQAGYTPWTVPKVLAEMDRRGPEEKAGDKRRFV